MGERFAYQLGSGVGGTSFFLKKLPLKAAKPPTKAPVTEVNNINRMTDPPRGMICAIFCDSILSFLLSIHQANISHNRKIPKNPDKKDIAGFCRISRLTTKAAKAMLHQGRNKPITKLRSAVNKMAKIYFIKLFFFEGHYCFYA